MTADIVSLDERRKVARVKYRQLRQRARGYMAVLVIRVRINLMRRVEPIERIAKIGRAHV